ncbi:MAG: holo-ACP synthase [Candidatus Aminicenantes bacterium]|nr:MAG: holo-ACP synthase [Candidatus Aminicenantes bacterium]
MKGIGIDMIDVARIKKIVEKNRRFVERVFTETEIRYCEGKFRPAVHYAARFAAKEALFKAMGTGWRGGMAWTDISVENNELGKPGITLSGKTLENFKKNKFHTLHLSISHTREYAVALVIIE